MDQPAHAEKPCLNADPGHIEVIEPSPAFPRPGTVTVTDSLRRPLLSMSHGPASTAFHYVTLCEPTHAGGSTFNRTSATRRADHLARPKCPVNKPKYQTQLYQSR